MSRFGIYLPLPVIATLLAFVYGLSIHRGWQSAILTLALVVLGGCLGKAVGQLIGVIVSALLIFLLFSMPEHKRQAHEDFRREQETARLPNEEDL